MDVSNQLQAAAALSPVYVTQKTGCASEKNWTWGEEKNCYSCQESNPDRPVT